MTILAHLSLMPAIVTGIGLLTPLGPTTAATWSALLQGRHVRNHRADSRTIYASAINVVRQAMTAARWSDAESAAVVIGTSKGTVRDWLRGSTTAVGISELAERIAHELHADGPRLTYSAACASSLHALTRGAMLIESGEVSRAIIIGAEASVHDLFVSSFHRLGVLAADNDFCRPFDQDRSGFLMTDAAAAVCLEAGNDGIAIDTYALAGDAETITRGESSGHVLSSMIHKVINRGDVQLVHAHATGTALDVVELDAIDFVLNSPTPVYSHKGSIGHSLGASGLVSIVLNVLMMQRQFIPPMPTTPNPELRKLARITPAGRASYIRSSLAIANGFGGALAAVKLTQR